MASHPAPTQAATVPREKLSRMRYRQYFTLLATVALLGFGLGEFAHGRAVQPQRAIAYFRIGTGSQASQLLSPEGEVFHLRALAGLRLVSPAGPRTDLSPAYVDQRAGAILTGLRQLGFNTIGGESDADLWHRGVPYIETLDLAAHLAAQQQQPVVNVYDPGFVAAARAWAEMACAPRAGDPTLIGYLSDTALDWDQPAPAARLLTEYLALPAGTAGRERAEDYVRIRYGSDIQKLNRAWGTRVSDFISLQVPAATNPAATAAFRRDAAPFAARVLARYLQTAADAIHAADANHLFLGASLSAPAEPGLAQGGSSATVPSPQSNAALLWQIADVASVTVAENQDIAQAVDRIRHITSRPILLRVEGCSPDPSSLAPALRQPGVMGYVWAPAGPWETGNCSLQAHTFWRSLNPSGLE